MGWVLGGFFAASLWLAGGFGAMADDSPSTSPQGVDFVRDIQPIFKTSCYQCHGPDKQKGQLRFDSKDSALAGGQSGKIIQAGNSKDSRLTHRVLGLDGDDRMPLKSDPLPPEKIVLLKAWIDQGAKWPDSASVADARIERHWAYVKPVRPELPKVSDPAWCRNPIDSFVLAKLEKEGLHPSPPADRTALIRRVSLDLVGLPPTIKEVDDFVNDKSPDAYEKLVERLLASPHYGERQALHWLDLARYADSNGYEKDRVRSMWPYRDWVINAINKDLPFDQFTIEQLAGDLLSNATRDQKIATGFNRNTMLNEEGGVDVDEYYYNSVVDRVNTTATVWLGTTMACSQCHNHKYDPFTQKDFYRFLGYFNSTAPETIKPTGIDPKDISPRLVIETPQIKELRKEVAELELKTNVSTPALEASQEKWEQKPSGKIPPNITAILAVDTAYRNETQFAELAVYYRTIAPELLATRNKIAALRKTIDAIPKTTLVMRELPQPRETHIHIRGAFLTLGDQVEPGVPAIFTSQQSQSALKQGMNQNRLDLARWLVGPENPLTARVTVNRIWEQYFGKGIVATSEDFGSQGEPPINQPLLDWLACEFREPTYGATPWSVKAMHRLIVMSSTYRQSSDVTPALVEKDPHNRLLARGPRFRLPAELIRDQALTVSGLLSEKIGGPSVFPLQPDGVWHTPYNGDKWMTSEGEDRFRRGIYTFQRRSSPYPQFMAFDKTSLEAICTRRSRTDTPLQALTTLNDPAFIQAAAALARRIVKEGGDTAEKRATFAFRNVLSRTPDNMELDRVIQLHDQMLKKYQDEPAAAASLASSGLPAPAKEVSTSDLAAWTMVSNVLLNLDETLTKE